MLRARAFEELKVLGAKSLRRIVGSKVGNCREVLVDESTGRSAALAADREALIAEFRETLNGLVNAFR